MESLARYSFLLNAVLLILHEMDAVLWREWRIFGVKDDAFGRVAFLLVHVPIFALILLALVHFTTRSGRAIASLMAAFLIVHFFLHWSAFSRRLFNEPVSAGIIAAMLAVSLVQLGATFYPYLR